MSKTPMQELIDYLEKQVSEHPKYCKKGNIQIDVLNGMYHSNCNILAMTKKLLEKEKEQIIESHTHAYLIGEWDITEEDANEAGEKYYNNKYNK